jgi:hypothetical protein
MVIKFPAYLKPEGSLLYSQKPITGLYPLSAETLPYVHTLRSILRLSSNLCLGPPDNLFYLGFSNSDTICDIS